MTPVTDSDPSQSSQTPKPIPELVAAEPRGSRAPLYSVIVITLLGMGAVVYGTFASTTNEPLNKTSHDVIAKSCADAYTGLKKLPPLKATATFADRASLVTQENLIFTAMTNTIATTHTENHDGEVARTKWVEDWRSVIERRAMYAADLLKVGDASEPAFPKDEGGAPVTNRMNQFSRTHTLIGCATHNLQAEIIDGVRVYPTDPTKVP